MPVHPLTHFVPDTGAGLAGAGIRSSTGAGERGYVAQWFEDIGKKQISNVIRY